MGEGLSVVLTGSLEVDDSSVLLAWALLAWVLKSAPAVPNGGLPNLMYP